MGLAYQGKARETDFTVKYVVKTSGDRWFIPYNNNSSTADQLARCKVMSGKKTGPADAGSELVAT